MLMFRANHGPLVIGGMGGSGTRVYLRLARLAGWRMIVCPWWDRNRRKIEEGSGDCQPLMRHFYPTWLHRWQRGDMTQSELRRMRWSCRFWLFASDPPAHIPFLRRLERWPARANVQTSTSPNVQNEHTHASSHVDVSTLQVPHGWVPGRLDVSAKRWGWKNPRAMNLLPFFNELFPSMRYIQVIRDGRDHAFHPDFTYGNYQSAVLTEDEEDLPDHVRKALVWKRRNEQTEDYGQSHMPGRYIHSRLEDLCDDPVGEITRLFRFLGVQGPADGAGETAGGGELRWLAAAGAALVRRPGSLGRWSSQPPTAVAEAERAMSPLLERLGYLTTSPVGPPVTSGQGGAKA